MENRIASFLLKHQYCPVGKSGSLQIRHIPASYLAAEKMMSPSRSSIEFSKAEVNDEELLHHVTRLESCSREDARRRLDGFYQSLQELTGTREMPLPGLGRFFAGPSGSLQFRPQTLPECFRPPVPAERVIRANSSVTVLVGDRETVTRSKSDNDKKVLSPGKNIPWKYAAALGFISALLIIWYVSRYGVGTGFGNRAPVEVTSPAQGYRIK